MKKFLFILAMLLSFHSAAQVRESQKAQFYKKNVEPLNSLIQKKLVGYTDEFIINEYLAIYSEQSQYLIYANLKTNTSSSLRLNDSFLYALIFNIEQVSELEAKMVLYKSQIDDIPRGIGHSHVESRVSGFCYYGDHIYVSFNVMNFYGMKTQVSPARKNSESVYFYQSFLIELNIKDSMVSKGRILDMTMEKEKYTYRYAFSVSEEQPALYLKTSIEDKDHYEYILLSKEWGKKKSLQLLPSMMTKWISENIFYNEYTLNTQLNILINNQTGKRIKISPGTGNSGIWSGHMIPVKNIVYVSVVNSSEHNLYVYKVDLYAGKSDLVNIYKLSKEFNIYNSLNFFIDQSSNILYIMNINLEKQFYIVDAIKL